MPSDAAGRVGVRRRRADGAVSPRSSRAGPGDRAGPLQAAGLAAAGSATAVAALARSSADRRDRAIRSARHAIDVRDEPVCAFLGPQMQLATEHCGQLDPIDLDEYLRHDGFKALAPAASSSCRRSRSIAEIQASGLRGRGGAGFPTGISGPRSARPPGEKKYVICNGDEGDPGAFMDRMLLESFPYRVIEGMAIAARAVGADEGYLLYPRRVSAGRGADPRGAAAVPPSGACWATRAAAATSACNCRSRKGRGPSSAARRRRCWPRSRAAAACRGCGRPIRPRAACGASPR